MKRFRMGGLLALTVLLLISCLTQRSTADVSGEDIGFEEWLQANIMLYNRWRERNIVDNPLVKRGIAWAKLRMRGCNPDRDWGCNSNGRVGKRA